MPIDNERLKKAKALITQARLLQRSYLHIPEANCKENIAFVILNGIPIFNSLLKRLNSASSDLSKMIKKTGDAPISTLTAAQASPFVGITFTILDFIQIPLLYLTAFALGEKPPITLSNNTRWAYAGVLLALCLTAFFIPVTAPFIAIASASLGFLASVFTLSKIMRNYYIDKCALDEIMDQINAGPAGKLNMRALELEAACHNPVQNSRLIDKLIVETERLKQQGNKQKNDIMALHAEAYLLNEKIKIEADIVDNCIGIALSSLAISGTVVSLFFPPAGLIILLTTTLAGIVYIGARFAAPNFFGTANQSAVTSYKENGPPSQAQKQVTKGSTNILLSKFKLKDQNHPIPNISQAPNETLRPEKKTGPFSKKSPVEKESSPTFKH